VAVSLAGAAMAPLLVRWYGSHEFVWPYLALLLTVPLTGLTGVPMAKLERELDFRRVAGIELGGQVVGLMLAITLAWFGGGVWAPVGGQIAWQIFVLAAAFSSAGLFPRPHLDRLQAWEMLRFGIGITASQRVWQLRTLVNPLLVGRFAGAEGVAFVALAIRIAEALGTFRLAAGRMAIAALARLQDSPEKFRAALERAIYLQVMALGPLLCVFALLGPLIVEHLIGVRWVPCLAIFPFVAAGVLVNSVYNLQASALFVTGQQWIVMRSYLAHVALLGTGTWLLLPRLGIAGYGWAELPACAAYFLIHAELAGRVEIRYRKLVPWLAVFLALLSIPLTRGSWIVAAMLICAGIGWLARAVRPRVCRKELPMKSLALTLSLALAFFLASCSPSLPTAETTERASTEILRVIAENRLIAMQMKCLEEPLSDAQKNYLLASRSEYVIQSYLSALGAGAECQKRALRVCERTDPGQCVAVPGELNGRRPN
jgi:PST family polysaccharide transporter